MAEAIKKSGVVFVDGDMMPELHPLRRWGYPLGLYKEALGLVPKVQDFGKHAELSWLMDSYWRERGSPNSILTLQGLGSIYKALSGVYPALGQPGDMVLEKQQPSLIETTDATLKRLKFLYQYVKNLTGGPYVSVITGGSMSYGRFYNVRDGVNPSDIDMIIVFKDGREGQLNANGILPRDFGFTDNDRCVLQERMRLFASLLRDKKVDILSQTADIRSLGFSVAVDIMPTSVFENMMVYNPHQDLQTGLDVERHVKQYRTHPSKHRLIRLSNFFGEYIFFSVKEEQVSRGVIESEVISLKPAHAIVKGAFVPGVFHNLLSPRFEMEAFSSRQCIAAATMFWSQMIRLEGEYREIDQNASALRSHIRYPLFNPMMFKNHH